MPTTTTTTTFNDRASRYRCWGDCIHVKTLTIVISCIQIVFSCGNLIHEEYTTGAYFIAGSVVVSAILMLIGVLKLQAALLLPSIVITCIGIFGLFIQVFWAIFKQISGDGKLSDIFTAKYDDDEGKYYVWHWYAQALGVALLNLVFFIVFIRCYKYIKDYKQSHQSNSRVQYSNVLQMPGNVDCAPPSYEHLKGVTVVPRS